MWVHKSATLVGSLVAVLILLTYPHSANQLDYVGCYREGIDDREMNISAGNYNPSHLTPELCVNLCQPDYRYAGLMLGRLCFCGDFYGRFRHNEPSQCSLTCLGDGTKPCGSETHSSIYAVPQAFSVNSVISPTDVAAFSKTVFTLDVEGSSFASVVVEFGDGYTETFSSQSFSHLYLTPGFMQLEATVLDTGNASHPTASYLHVHLPILDIERHCPIAVLPGEVFDCEFTADGTGMQASIDIEGVHSFNATMADAYVLMFGPDLDQTLQPLQPDIPGLFVKLVDRVTDDAVLVGWEFVAENPGPITFMVYRPQQIEGQTFCYRTLDYIDESEDCLRQPSLMQHKCTTGEKYSFTKRSCVDIAARNVTNPDVSQPQTITYVTVFRYNLTTSRPGKQFHPLPDAERFELQAGDLVGILSQGTSVIRRIQPAVTSDSDVQIPDSEMVSIGPNPSPSSGQFLFRAVAVRPSRFHIKGQYDQNSMLGPRNIQVSFQNAVSSQTYASVIYVQNVINDVSLTATKLAGTDETVVLVVDYVGDALAVDWDMGDGTTYNMTDATTHQWGTAGAYNVTVRVYNHYNAQSDTKLVIVQDRIGGLNWTTMELGTPILLGSEAYLEWSADTGTDVKYVFEFDWNLGGPATNFTLMSEGASVASLTTSDWDLQNFLIQLSADALNGTLRFIPEGPGVLTVSLNVFNLISDERIRTKVVIQSAISGFNVSEVPPQIFGADILLAYELASGSDVIVEMTVDDEVRGVCVTTNLEGECMLGYQTEYFEAGEYSIQLSARNGVSGPFIQVTNITIQVPVSNSSLSAEVLPALIVATGTNLSFLVNISQGSEIHLRIDFGDDSDHVTGFTSCVLPGCENKLEVDHTFSLPGVYVSQVLAWNLVSRAVHSVEVQVLNPVTSLSMVQPVPLEVIGVAKDDAYEITIVFKSITLQPTDATAVYSIPSAFYNYTLDINNTATYPVTQIIPVPTYGWYGGNVKVFNLISEVTFAISVQVEEFIEDFSIVPTGGCDLVINEELFFDLEVYWGSRITFLVDFGDGTDWVNATNAGRSMQVSHVYDSIGERLISAQARNRLGLVTAGVFVRLFHPVKGFFLQAPLLYRFPPVGSLTVEVQLYIKRDTVLANNITVTIRFDDDDPNVFAVNASDTSQPALDTQIAIHIGSFSKNYSEPGKFTVSARLTNPASSQDLLSHFWIYKEISDLQAFLKYSEFSLGNFSMGDPALDQDPFVANGLYTPIDHAVVLVATFASGNNLAFTWDFGETPGLHTVTDEPREIYWYKDPGVYNVTVNASNPVSFMTASVRVNVQVPVDNVTLTLLDIGDLTSNVTMYFEVRASSLGTDACYRVDFQDSQIAPIVYFGSETVCRETYETEINFAQYLFIFEPLDMLGKWEANGAPGAFNITNIYNQYGTYEISVTGSNIVSSSTFLLSQSVAKPDCFPPKVSVMDSNLCDGGLYKCAQDTQFRVFLASVQIIINSEVSVNCKSSLKAWYEWSVSYFGDSLENEEQDFDLPDDTMTGGMYLGNLIIQPASLRYGWYRFELNVSMSEEYPPIYATDFTYIRVDPSPLVVQIYGGYERTVSYNSTIIVDAERLTYDPDIPRGSANPNGTRFVWLCRRESYYSTKTSNTTFDIEPFEVWDKFYENRTKDGSDNKNDEIDASEGLVDITDHGGCFGLLQEQSVPLPGGKLEYTTGVITFSSAPMYYNMKYELKVAVIKGDRVGEATQILAIQEGSPPILETFCKVNCKRKLNPSNRYSLEAHEAFGGNNFFSLYYKWEVISKLPSGHWKSEPEWIHFALTPANRANIVIDLGFFQESTKYRLKLIGSRNYDFSNAGSVLEVVNVNDRPQNGTCSVAPLEGEALVTDFNISCEGWVDVDEDLPLSYTFKVDNGGASSVRTIHASPRPQLDQPTKLSQGLPENDYMVRITVDVTDCLGCFNTTHLDVKVFPPDNSTDVTGQLKTIEASMETLFADAKMASAANLVIAAADFLNTKSADNGTETSATDVEDSSSIGERTKLRGNMAEKLSEAQVGTVEGVQQLSSAMAAVTKVPREVAQNARTRLLGSMESYSKVLQNNSQSNDPLSVEMLEAATSVCMEVVENIVEATTHSTQDEELAESSGVDNMLKSEEVVDRLASAISAKMVLGQSDVQVTSSKSTLVLAKSPVLWISNKTFSSGDGNSLQLPLYEDLFQDTDNFTAVTQKFIMRDRSTKVFAAGGQEVNSMVVSLTLINETDQTPMAVANASSPIQISVSRSKNHLTVNGSAAEKTVYVNRTAPVGGKMVIHQIDVPPRYALVLEVRALGTEDMRKGLSYDVNLYILMRQGGNPSREIHDFNCTLRQRVTVQEGYIPTNASVDLGFNLVLSNDSQTRCFFASNQLEVLRNGSSLSLRYGVNHEVWNSSSAADNKTSWGSSVSSRFHPMYYALTSSLYTCLAIGDKQNEWSTDGCEVGENSTDTLTQCLCDHLTMFGGGLRIPINHIDLSDSAFLKLDENPVVFIFMICCLSLYLLVIFWARKVDKRDVVKAGITPLPDNDPRGRYHYIVTVYTGVKNNAGTTANVTILISGDLGDSGPRVLRDPKRKVHQAGGVDTFLLASATPLGNLNFVRVWHDNQGKRPAWYLARIMVRDLRLDRTFYFMADRWLAVEEDDGMIERVFPVAGKSELTSFGHLFSTKSRRSLSDSHLWFSVFTRPVKSKFTRVQRATCCLSLLFCTMMANIFFYGVDFQDVSGTQVVYSIGPISFSFGQVVIGVISSLMVLPINLIVVQLFRLSRPIPPCKSARKNRTRVDNFRRLSFESEQSRSTNDLEKELARMDAQVSSRSVPSISLKLLSQTSLQSQPRTTDLLADPTADTMPPRDDQTFKPVLGFKRTKRIRKGLELPWPCCVLAWLLVVISVALAFWLTIEVAGQFGRAKATEWLTSMCFSLIQDIFITQPFKVLLLALFFSLVIRDPEKEENSNLVMAPHLQDDEEWLHDRMTTEELEDPTKMAELRRLKDQTSAKNLAPLHPEELAEAREIRFKEIKMHKIIREIIFYLIFLNITMLICFGDRDPDVYYVNKSMTDMFVKASYNGRMLFTKIRGRDHFWNYTENVFLPSLYSHTWYNGDLDEIGRKENYLPDNNLHLVGRVRFRQLRIQKDACTIPDVMHKTLKSRDCRAPYSISSEDATSYDVGWVPLNASALPNYADRYMASWKYNNWYDVSSFPYYGKHAFYNGGGYIIELGDSLAEDLQLVGELQRDKWVDQRTRAVFMEFVVYNANVNMYATSFMLVEFLPQGGATPYPIFWTIRLDRYIGNFAYFVLAGQIVYTLFIIYFLFRETRNIFREKRAYFNSFWNLCEICILLLAVASIVFYLYRMFVGWELMEQWQEHPKMFLNFHFVAYWDQLYGYITAFVLFLVNVKFIRLLRFNRRLLLFSLTLRQCSKDLGYYSIIFGIVFGAYALFAYAIFHLHLENFSTFVWTLETLFSTMLGKFDFQEMISVHSFLGPAFFFTYVVIIVFIMINMFLSIIMETFSKVRHDNEAIENELEIVNFMLQRFKQWTGYSERRLQKPVKREDYIEGVDPEDEQTKLLRDKLTTMVDRLNLFIRAERGTVKSDRQIYLTN